jgi:hypothetical protein
MKVLKTYEVKIRQWDDHYDVTVIDKSENEALIATSTCRLNSPKGDLTNTDSRRTLLDAFFANIKHLLRQRTFPQDTLVYDEVMGPHGKKLINPRYPNALPRHLKKDFGTTVPGSDD